MVLANLQAHRRIKKANSITLSQTVKYPGLMLVLDCHAATGKNTA